MSLSDVELSRALSHALRHQPWLYELELDDEGWAPLDQVLSALRERGDDWTSVDREAIERMLVSTPKNRHELVGERIRALYGHSLSGRIQQRISLPPTRLFHGTSPDAWAAIQSVGLLPMRRQFVHLSRDPETAVSVGRRKSPDPVILAVNAADAYLAGVVFYEGSHLVWLADRVPPRFIEVAE